MQDSCDRTLPKRWRIAADAPSPPATPDFCAAIPMRCTPQGPEPPSRCANRRLCTPRFPKPRHGVRIGASAHRSSRNPVTVCESAPLHTAVPETPSRCAIRPFCTPRFPNSRHGVRFAHFAHRSSRNPVTVCDLPILHTATSNPHIILHDPPRHPELDSGSSSRKPRFLVKPG